MFEGHIKMWLAGRTLPRSSLKCGLLALVQNTCLKNHSNMFSISPCSNIPTVIWWPFPARPFIRLNSFEWVEVECGSTPSKLFPLFRTTSRADAINISGLLVKESRLLNPKKLGNFKKLNAIKKFSSLDSYFLESPDLGVSSGSQILLLTPI